MIKASGRRKRRAMFVSAASSPGEGLMKVEEFERRGEEMLEPFALAGAEWRILLHRHAGVPHKWPTEE
jgi:hypothetical protein